MLKPLTTTIHNVLGFTWPMLIITIVVLVSFRICYILKYKIKFTFYKELIMLSFFIYIICLFQVVTFRDNTLWASNNFIPFKEILRYNMTSRLFYKNVIGNMLMFLPYGFFISYYLKSEKITLIMFLTFLVSISIELVQLSIGRVFDVDDIILNLIGGCLGFIIYYLLTKIGEKLPKIFHNEIFLNIISIIILIGIITLL